MFEPVQSGSGMELHDLLFDPAFLNRPRSLRAADREAKALRHIVRGFVENPGHILQSLVDSAIEFCGADSAGISLEEVSPQGEKRFRWIVVSGSFEKYLNGTTPRNYSPCGTCLDRGRPQYYRVTQPYYNFLGLTADEINDGILIPWVSQKYRGTLWAVSHRPGETFELSDYNVLQSLADFVALALRYETDQRLLRQEEIDATSAARAHEMAHRINNPLQSVTNTLYLARFGEGIDREAYLEQASRDLAVLSEVVRNLLSITRSDQK